MWSGNIGLRYGLVMWSGNVGCDSGKESCKQISADKPLVEKNVKSTGDRPDKVLRTLNYIGTHGGVDKRANNVRSKHFTSRDREDIYTTLLSHAR